MEKCIHARISRMALTLTNCPEALYERFAYSHTKITWDKGNFQSKTSWMRYAQYDAAARTCYTYPNALHLAQQFARTQGYTLEIEDQRARPRLDITPLDKSKYRSACYQALQAVAAQQESGQIIAPTGVGKTSIICGLIELLPKDANFKILVTTEEKDVVGQIYRTLRQWFPAENIGMINKPHVEMGRIMIVNLDALKDLSQGEIAVSDYGLKDYAAWICDEEHRLPVESRIQYVAQLRPAYAWGLTATPKRSDNAHELNQAYFGPVLYEKSHGDVLAIQAETRETGIVPIKVQVFPLPTDKLIPEELSLYHKTRLAYAQNSRLRLLVREIDKMLPAEEKVLIFSDTRRLAVILKGCLPHYELVHGEIPSERRRALLQQFKSGEIRRVIATDVWSEGVDVPDLNYVVDCSYKLSSNLITQRAGRAARSAQSKACGHYLMFLCLGCEHLFNHGIAKLQHFNKMGWDVCFNFSESLIAELPYSQAPILVELGSFVPAVRAAAATEPMKPEAPAALAESPDGTPLETPTSVAA